MQADLILQYLDSYLQAAGESGQSLKGGDLALQTLQKAEMPGVAILLTRWCQATRYAERSVAAGQGAEQLVDNKPIYDRGLDAKDLMAVLPSPADSRERRRRLTIDFFS